MFFCHFALPCPLRVHLLHINFYEKFENPKRELLFQYHYRDKENACMEPKPTHPGDSGPFSQHESSYSRLYENPTVCTRELVNDSNSEHAQTTAPGIFCGGLVNIIE